MKSRRALNKEFKTETAALVEQEGMTINRVAKDIGLTWTQVDKWVKQATADRGDNTDMLATAEKEELRGLRRENRILKVEREILKKAAAFFAKESE